MKGQHGLCMVRCGQTIASHDYVLRFRLTTPLDPEAAPGLAEVLFGAPFQHLGRW